MLDCSHSMILYGEDRFTPAKKVALALAHLIRTQYPGDSLRCVLFHDSAEELRNFGPGASAGGSVLHQHARRPDPGAAAAEPGKEGHEADHHDHRRQAFGADARRRAHVPQRLRPGSAGDQPTLEEVGRCKKQGILINTFMLASDFGLVNFVQKVTELCRGKAYFTTPYNLGQYLLMDYMNRKTRTIHYDLRPGGSLNFACHC
jgi:Ca-activated chloride channel family protein